MLPSPRVYATWLGLLRICTGAFWLIHGIPKFTNSDKYMPPNGFMPQVVQKAMQGGPGPYHDFLANVVTPHIGLFAELVRLGEVVAGLLLFFGLLTRLGGLIGVVLALNYMASFGEFTSFQGWSGLDAAVLGLSAIHFVLPTGKMLGVDGLLGRGRTRKSPLLTPEFVDEPPLRVPGESTPS
ncbi:MAG: DoxX family membrane protein [Candidatus Eremiobacteraeota bacterium]|nr:DoxX family membrane protein [Candidatus Eremiobacteraeota bacterium]